MSRRGSTDESSLELLLDTICNTFGGILFLAILVVVLLQMSHDKRLSPEEELAQTAAAAQLESKLAAALDELDVLRQAALAQAATLEQLAPRENQDELASLVEARAKREELSNRLNERLKDLARMTDEIDQIQREDSELDTRQTQSQQSLDAAQAALRAELAKRTRTASLPTTRASSKLEVAIVVRYGRMYFLYKYGDRLLDRRFNQDDFISTGETPSHLKVSPKPYAGLPVESSATSQAAIRSSLGRFDHRAIHFTVATWDDSFEQFAILRNIIVDQGFEYRLLPIPLGGSIVEDSGTDGLVQ